MSTPARKRLMRDFRRLTTDPPAGVNGSPNPDNIMMWNCVIFGPEDTPWDGGEARLRTRPQARIAEAANAASTAQLRAQQLLLNARR
jgi:hypothetical protein